MEKLSVKDLVMFYGCECECKTRSRSPMKLTIDSYTLSLSQLPYATQYVKPFLRPLSDMTDKEAEECFDLTGERYVANPKCALIDRTFNHKFNIYQEAKIIKYLLSKYFDVFGWIEKGLALDKTKLA